eukprot:scaffold1187_cov258-Pinguiococcus_pyrenoidosus.AAC.8
MIAKHLEEAPRRSGRHVDRRCEGRRVRIVAAAESSRRRRCRRGDLGNLEFPAFLAPGVGKVDDIGEAPEALSVVNVAKAAFIGYQDAPGIRPVCGVRGVVHHAAPLVPSAEARDGAACVSDARVMAFVAPLGKDSTRRYP